MAFCPECGKPVTADTVTCEQCGHTLPVQVKKKAAGGRFNGTVMMAAVPRPAAKSASPASAPPLAARAEVPNTPQGALPAKTVLGVGGLASAAASAVAAASAAGGGVKATPGFAKHTMLGAGMAPPVARAVAAASEQAAAIHHAAPTHAVSAAAQQHAAAAQALAFAATPLPPSPDSPTTSGTHPSAQRAGADASDRATVVTAHSPTLLAGSVPEQRGRDAEPIVLHTSHSQNESVDAPRQYLPGDPMAPQPAAAMRPGGSARLRLSDDETGANLIRPERPWLYWAICAVVVACVLLLAVGFGLIG